MELGAFSVSLAVKDIHASKAFYEKLGFSVLGGDIAQNWLIMKNNETVIGLFQGMFNKNMLTFNPGWDSSGKDTERFTDVRELAKGLEAQGLNVTRHIDAEKGPGYLELTDPDGNPILIDQHRS